MGWDGYAKPTLHLYISARIGYRLDLITTIYNHTDLQSYNAEFSPPHAITTSTLVSTPQHPPWPGTAAPLPEPHTHSEHAQGLECPARYEQQIEQFCAVASGKPQTGTTLYQSKSNRFDITCSNCNTAVYSCGLLNKECLASRPHCAPFSSRHA